MRLLRFERKILLALLAVALFPLGASVILGRAALRDTYQVGVNARIREQLDGSLAVYRAYFRATRAAAEATAAEAARSGTLRDATVAGSGAVRPVLSRFVDEHQDVVAIALLAADGVTVIDEVRRASTATPATTRRLALRRPLLGTAHVVRVVIATDAAPFAAYQRAGNVAEIYRRLESQAQYLSATYWIVYTMCLVLVIAAAAVTGMVLSRRVTRRIADLIRATERVGRGDLTATLAPRSQDEIGELTEAFNRMVRDLNDSRSRIAYLTRVSGWQEFAQRLAHEIKNPLTPIQLAAQELERSFHGDDPRHRQVLREARTIIEEEVATLRRLVGEFSSFAKLPDVVPVPSNLNDFVEELGTLAAAIEADLDHAVSVSLTLTPAPQVVVVALDAMLLRRAFDNLIRNAAQAARDAGRAAVSVAIRVRVEPPSACIAVEDDGPGIAVDARPGLFEPYATTKSYGSGLGLAIVKKVILEHGGNIEYDTVTKSGARFSIQLPLGGSRNCAPRDLG